MHRADVRILGGMNGGSIPCCERHRIHPGSSSAVHPFSQLSSRFEVNGIVCGNSNGIACAGITAEACGMVSIGEASETPHFNSLSGRQGGAEIFN
jgi:hypothetical protein